MPTVNDALRLGVESVMKDWKHAKRNEERVGREAMKRIRFRPPREVSIKEAAFAVMEQAYLKASADGRYAANARQIMYAARPLVLAATGGKSWKSDAYFTQTLLPDYVQSYGRTDWDVVYDARGHLREPHTEKEIGLGTIEARTYQAGWLKAGVVNESADQSINVHGMARLKTSGPRYRYGAVLFLEKEGFNPLLEQAQIAERFDVAIMSTKGMSVTASRMLVEAWTGQGVPVYVLHDFDKSGFSILHTLHSSTRRYQFRGNPLVHDLGLRLADVQELGLDSEPVDYDGNIDPRINLRASGATKAECDFLVDSGGGWSGWAGQRVELNAMTSDQFVEWLEQKLTAAGVEKIVPDEETLAATYRRAKRLAVVQKTLDSLAKQAEANVEVPADLVEKVKAGLADDEAESWDTIIWDIALLADGESEL
jgi:hypothetical protein